MEKLVVVDGNSILNRAFYGIMGNKMLQTADGTYTNAVYGFLSIMFKELEDLEPEYMAVAFDLKGPTKRHEMYEKYKAKRAALKAAGDLEGLQKLPRNSSPTRLKNRDLLDGRPRGYMRRFGLSRINFREKASKGEIPGVTKSSW